MKQNHRRRRYTPSNTPFPPQSEESVSKTEIINEAMKRSLIRELQHLCGVRHPLPTLMNAFDI